MLYSAVRCYRPSVRLSVRHLSVWLSVTRVDQSTRCRAIAGSTARCGCKFRYISNFSAVLGGFHCDNNAFELHNRLANKGVQCNLFIAFKFII